MINWGLHPSAGYSCTNTELGLARIPLLVPIYLFTVCSSPRRCEVSPLPNSHSYRLFHFPSATLAAPRQSAARDKLPWTSWPQPVIHDLHEQPAEERGPAGSISRLAACGARAIA